MTFAQGGPYIRIMSVNDKMRSIVYTPPFLLGGRRWGLSLKPPTTKLKKGGIDRISIFRRGLLGKRGDLFQGVAVFT